MTAKTYVSALYELQVVLEGETEQTHDQRLNTLLHEALSGMDDALVAITLENVGNDIETTFRELRNAFGGYTYAHHANRTYSVKVFNQADFEKEMAKAT